MNARDPHRFSHELDDELTQRIINRLESRARDEVFTRLFHQYADKLDFAESALTLEIGCGTGAVARALAKKAHFAGSIVGVDQSRPFIDAAQQFAAEEGVDKAISFSVCDGHALDFDDESFDLAIAHTLISHVTDPTAIITELARVIRKNGTLVILDGDYASLTYAVPDHEFGLRMDHNLATASFNNPMVMRDLVSILPAQGFMMTESMADVVSEIGQASYFKSFAETYAPLVAKAGLMTDSEVDGWFDMINQAMDDGTFFASCNYYTYIAKRIDGDTI
jgi:ubiquinone/menaquinone biosynthesis C-methylase UbiE